METNTVKVAIASDFSGFLLKEQVKRYLEEKGYTLEDVGQRDESQPMMYYDAAVRLADAVQYGGCVKGIVCCGTGAGVSLIANKHKGIYCVACESVFTASRIALINNANVLAMGEKVVSYAMACEMAEAFIQAQWCDGFDAQRRKNNENGYAMMQLIENGMHTSEPKPHETVNEKAVREITERLP